MREMRPAEYQDFVRRLDRWIEEARRTCNALTGPQIKLLIQKTREDLAAADYLALRQELFDAIRTGNTSPSEEGASILIDPHPRSHIVYPYSNDMEAVDAVFRYADAGLSHDEAVLLVVTPEHRSEILERLSHGAWDVDSLEHSGQLQCLDAEELLRRFMINGMPDETLMRNAICIPIIQAQSNGRPRRREVRIFGEMVSLLWENNCDAAVSLEAMWNRLIPEYSIALFCGYALGGTERESFPQCLIDTHSVVLAAA